MGDWCRAHINLGDFVLPLTPLDDARVSDGRVYVKFFEAGTARREYLVGTLSRAELAGERRLKIKGSGNGHEVPVVVERMPYDHDSSSVCESTSLFSIPKE